MKIFISSLSNSFLETLMMIVVNKSLSLVLREGISNETADNIANET